MPARQHSTQVKKRPAKSGADSSKARKVRVVAKEVAVPVKTPAKGKGKAKESDSERTQKKKRRNVPVTVQNDEQESDDSDLSEDEDEEGQNDLDDDAEDEEVVEDRGEVGAPQDSKNSQERHKTQKALLAQRRASKPHAELISEAKRVWSLARQKNVPTAERQTHIQDLMTVIRGHVKDFVLKHDASRIVQTIVKYGNQKERSEIATELNGQFRNLAQNRYSKFLVSKLIRLCPGHRSSILSEFQSHVLRLLLHREASSVLADAFELYANAYERSLLLRDFYGKEATLFTVTEGSEADKEKAKKALRGVLEGTDPERRKRIMNAVKDNLMSIFNNPDKGAITHAIVHRALWDYVSTVNETSDEIERERLRREIFEGCQEILAEMVHTKDGSRVVRDFLARGNAKDRKQILKVLKPHIERMCLDDEAQLVLFTALDTIDDTKLLAKSVVSSITSVLSSTPKPGSKTAPLHTTPQGRRSLIHLLTPRTRRHFTPAQIALMEETDAIRDQTSKKPAALREEEVRKAASPDLVSWIAEKGESVVKETGGCLVITEIMLYAEGDKTTATNALLRPLCTPYPSSQPDDPHPIDLPHTSRLYKTLLQGGHFNHTTQKIEYIPSWDAVRFAIMFVNTIDKDVIVNTCTKGSRSGAFVVAELCSTLCNGPTKMRGEGDEMQVVDEELEDARDQARKLIKEWFAEVLELIQGAEEMKGRKVLLEALDRL
ncbi:armadillo-type protein [Amanita rubescens]|nr:armadillo-type protein [Amanita rubescens]